MHYLLGKNEWVDKADLRSWLHVMAILDLNRTLFSRLIGC